MCNELKYKEGRLEAARFYNIEQQVHFANIRIISRVCLTDIRMGWGDLFPQGRDTWCGQAGSIQGGIGAWFATKMWYG